MDFILGIFTGITLCLAYGHYLLRQRKKDEHNRAVMKNVISAFDEMSQWNGFVRETPERPSRYLQRMLEDAIANDDFEEAARLRDLINRK